MLTSLVFVEVRLAEAERQKHDLDQLMTFFVVVLLPWASKPIAYGRQHPTIPES